MLTIDDCERAALELAFGTRDEPSLRLALWASILSPQKRLDLNAAQVRVLRLWAERDLPFDDAEELKRHIKRKAQAKGMLYTSHCQAIIRVARLAESGALAGLERMPTSGREWIAWRKRVAHLPGLSWKTASFAALILWPFECPFVPV